MHFFGELGRLTKKEYNIDLIDALQEGKLPDLLNDASTVRPDGARSFVALVNDSIESSLSVLMQNNLTMHCLET